MRRVYTSTAYFRAPFDGGSLTLTGLGSSWPRGRSYHDVSNLRAPYDSGYFQSGAMMGLGQLPEAEVRILPPKFQRYVRSGEPMGTFRRDLGVASAQVPRLVWGIGGALAGLMCWYSYKKFKKQGKRAPVASEQMSANRVFRRTRRRR